MKKRVVSYLTIFAILVTILSCASASRGCSSCMAEDWGADWVVVELTEAEAIPYRCWMLKDVSMTNEKNSDGIYWKSPQGHLVHVSGSYDYVQVQDGDWDTALGELNLTKESCARIQSKTYNPITNKYEYKEK